MPFEFKPLSIPSVILITPRLFTDNRGYFLETYKRSDFVSAGITENLVQDNYSFSTRGVIRGLHFQRNPAAQGKLVMCVSGKILDVAVDLRKAKPTCGKWLSEELDSKTRKMLYIPPGFAHGFCVLSETAEVLYKVTAEYSPENDAGIRYDDKTLSINWGHDGTPLVSEKDKLLPAFADCDSGF